MTALNDEIDVRHGGRYHIVDLTQEEIAAVLFAHGPYVLAVFSTPLDEGVHVSMEFFVEGERAYIPLDDEEGVLTDFAVTLPSLD